jgi:sulfonate transport system ATP-binding protein
VSARVSLERVRKAFTAARPLFCGLDLEVQAGEVVAVLGASGCGKSTLVRLIAGLERPDAGAVRVGDRSVNAPLEQVGLMFQEPRLLPWLDAAANVAFGLRDGLRSTVERSRRVRELLSAVGLPDAGSLLPHQLSGGMAQRVALARALARAPEVLLLDEPFGAVDALTRTGLQNLLLEVAARTRTTVLLVTHDVEEALRVAGRLVVLGGRPARLTLDAVVPGTTPRPPDRAGLAQVRHRALAALALDLDTAAAGFGL